MDGEILGFGDGAATMFWHLFEFQWFGGMVVGKLQRFRTSKVRKLSFDKKKETFTIHINL